MLSLFFCVIMVKNVSIFKKLVKRMRNLLPQNETMFNFSIGLLIVLIIVLVIFTGMLIVKITKLKEFIVKDKVDITATVISIIVISLCIGGIIAYLFCMNAMMG